MSKPSNTSRKNSFQTGESDPAKESSDDTLKVPSSLAGNPQPSTPNSEIKKSNNNHSESEASGPTKKETPEKRENSELNPQSSSSQQDINLRAIRGDDQENKYKITQDQNWIFSQDLSKKVIKEVENRLQTVFYHINSLFKAAERIDVNLQAIKPFLDFYDRCKSILNKITKIYSKVREVANIFLGTLASFLAIMTKSSIRTFLLKAIIYGLLIWLAIQLYRLFQRRVASL